MDSLHAKQNTGSDVRQLREFVASTDAIVPWPLKHLNGNAVKVFWYLMRIAGGVERTAIVRPPNVAAATGMSERQARQYLDELAAVGLIVIADRARKTRQRGATFGDWSCHVHDPRELGKFRLMPGESERYLDLFPALDDGNVMPVDRASLPFAPAIAGGPSGAPAGDKKQTGNSVPISPFDVTPTSDGKTGEKDAPAPLNLRPKESASIGPCSVSTFKGNGETRSQLNQGSRMQCIEELPSFSMNRELEIIRRRQMSPGERRRWIDERAAYIAVQIDDGKCEEGIRLSLGRRYAEAMLNLVLTEEDLEDIFRPMRHAAATEGLPNPVGYFTKAARRQFKAKGLDWDEKKKRRLQDDAQPGAVRSPPY
jgi:FaeA-like protein